MGKIKKWGDNCQEFLKTAKHISCCPLSAKWIIIFLFLPLEKGWPWTGYDTEYGLKLVSLLPLPPRYWDQLHVPPPWTYMVLRFQTRALYKQGKYSDWATGSDQNMPDIYHQLWDAPEHQTFLETRKSVNQKEVFITLVMRLTRNANC